MRTTILRLGLFQLFFIVSVLAQNEEESTLIRYAPELKIRNEYELWRRNRLQMNSLELGDPRVLTNTANRPRDQVFKFLNIKTDTQKRDEALLRLPVGIENVHLQLPFNTQFAFLKPEAGIRGPDPPPMPELQVHTGESSTDSEE